MDNESSRQERFGSENLFIDKDASFELFHPEKKGRDRFGNRIFGSKDLAFLNREGESVKAILLISPHGEEFIKSNPGILKNIDTGLREMRAKSADPQHRLDEVDLGNDRSLSYLSEGGQSIVYLLKTPAGKYVIKIKNLETKPYQDVTQPYVNEMLQMQSLSEDLGGELAQLKLDRWDPYKGEWIKDFKRKRVEMPIYLFASGLVACLKFEEGEKPDYNKDISPIIEPLHNLTRNYLNTKRAKHDPLWQNLDTDLLNPTILVGKKTDNFIKKPDGTLVWIDMFLYQPAWTLYKWLDIVKRSAEQGDKEAQEIVKRADAINEKINGDTS